MLGNQCRLQPVDQHGQPVEMAGIRWLAAAEPEADAMHRDGPERAGLFEIMPRRAATHIVFGVNLQPADRRPGNRKSVVWGQSVSGRVDLGGLRIIKKKTKRTSTKTRKKHSE